jgi:streptomycin 6-kinase
MTTADERFAAHARQWDVAVQEIRTTETSLLGFGTRGAQPVVLKVIRKEGNEEWLCGQLLEAFGGSGMIQPIAHAPGAVLLPRLMPGHDLVSLCLAGRDEEAAGNIATLIQRMPNLGAHPASIGTVAQMQGDFARCRHGGDGFIPIGFVDRAEALFAELCATQRNVRVLHGDLHHFNVLFDSDAGWVIIDPQGPIAEIEYEIGASLRNPAHELVASPFVLERRLRIYEDRLQVDLERTVKWAFATTVLGILWPFEPGLGGNLRAAFAAAVRAIDELM